MYPTDRLKKISRGFKMTEKFYDDVIAPKLMEIGELCVKNNIPFLAVIEYDPGELGRTFFQTADENMAMTMMCHCARTVPNMDSYVLGIIKWAKNKRY